ncbi:hypothetical protein [Proteus mirabilis]|uniref:hypothetical protein n=1 Tax=Proteus mirabilis TaxID=584 RepID=UPI0015804FD9|nr:hypothetical protein [Proteus mirabilis]
MSLLVMDNYVIIGKMSLSQKEIKTEDKLIFLIAVIHLFYFILFRKILLSSNKILTA